MSAFSPMTTYSNPHRTIASLQNQLQISTHDAWSAKEEARVLTLMLTMARDEISLRASDQKQTQNNYDTILAEMKAQSAVCVERETEIRNLRGNLTSSSGMRSGDESGGQGSQQENQTFTMDEVKGLCKLLDSYIKQTKRFKEIILTLETQLEGNLDPTTKSQLVKLRDQIKVMKEHCEKEKKKLQEEISAIKAQRDQIEETLGQVANETALVTAQKDGLLAEQDKLKETHRKEKEGPSCAHHSY